VFAARWVPRRGWGKWGWAALLVWLFAGTVWVHPHYLAYFNELAGGPLGGQRYLVDSNLDWGQSFVALREALDERNIDTLRLSYYTYADPAHYGIRYEPIAPARGAPATLPARFNPAPGVYVIGATPLQGVMVADPSTYDWFRHRPPDARPGFALFFYDVEEPQQPPTWLAQCTVPVVPLPPDAIAEGFGRDDLRLATFDCTQSWLFPTGGAEAGWYALFRDTAQSDSPFVQSHLVLARLSFEQTRSGALPPFAIYEAGGVPVPAHAFTETVAVGELRLLGYTLASSRVRAGETVEVWTYWRVEGLLQRLPSLMLHLIGADGVPLAVGDGLGVPVESWRVGDVFVQRHALAVPAGAPVGEATLVTGAYWLDSLERWAVHVGGEVGGDQFVLGTITFPEASSELPGR
ncbi:MAG: hypothetical protein JXD18_10465, partial [Anaerolineae bacterium]|nr:hypothetical protein [Anaerolineae bacterium]